MIHLNWTGKNELLNLLEKIPYKSIKKMDSQKVKRICPDKNSVILGDNLYGLRNMQNYLKDKIDLVIADPPYNTGYSSKSAEMQYSDDIKDSEEEDWLFMQLGESLLNKMTSHEKWLTMIYSRLFLAYQLLKETGSMFIAINDAEHANLKLVMDEIFGEKNFVNNIIWQKRTSSRNDSMFFSEEHNLILCYAKKKAIWRPNGLPYVQEDTQIYGNPDDDPRGEWTKYDTCTERVDTGNRFEIVTPSGSKYIPPTGGSWNFTREEYDKLVSDNKIWFGSEESSFPILKHFRSENNNTSPVGTIWLADKVGNTNEGKEDLMKALKSKDLPFRTPKPVKLVQQIVQIATDCKESLVLDIFAGSGTTGQAIIEQNRLDNGSRRFILIEAEKSAFNVAIERLERINNKSKRADDLVDKLEICT
jgi:adenine-specific DNA-methyltransferase